MKNSLLLTCTGFLTLSIVFFTTCTAEAPSPIIDQPESTTESGATPVYTYNIVDSYYHDPNAFTQGLVYDEGILYEGTGRYGQSSLRKVNLESGEILQIHELPDEYFGEGITVFQDKVFQLTWKSNTGFIYDRESFQFIRDFFYPTEGWGLTHDGIYLIMSDGTHRLHYINPDTLEIVRHIEIFDKETAVTRLNELEYINGEIYANVWQTDKIARISPETGMVVSWIDLTGLLDTTDYQGDVDVLNGIAYDTGNDRLLVTGKLWPRIFVIELKLPPAS